MATPDPLYIYVLVLVKPEGKTLYLRRYDKRRCLNTEKVSEAIQFNTSAAGYDFLNRFALPNTYHLMLLYNCGNNRWNPNGCPGQGQPTTVVG